MARRASRFATAVVAALAAAWAAVACAGPDQSLTPAQIEQFLEAHNTWRRTAGVRPLGWSADLARGAQARADRLSANGCRLSHRGLARNTGENLFAAIPTGSEDADAQVAQIAPAQVVNVWGAEGADYDYARNQCAPGKKCAHYTQIVWRGTREVGCATASCPQRGRVWVCNYRPAGNMEGQRPY